jgi:hypothetical protein
LLGFVAANALKDGGAVAHDVRKNVESGVLPVDPFSVVPDFFRLLDWHDGVLLVAPIEALPEFLEYGRQPRASMKCI